MHAMHVSKAIELLLPTWHMHSTAFFPQLVFLLKLIVINEHRLTTTPPVCGLQLFPNEYSTC
jgi:hypothetical protein